MNNIIYPSKINGTLNAPASKSEMQRVVAACLLCEGLSTILNPSFCDDAKVAIKVAEDLGAKVVISDGSVKIHGGLNFQKSNFHFGESALALRLFAPIIGLSGKECVLTGDDSLKKRPNYPISETLSNFGIECHMTNNSLPIRLNGRLKGNSSSINGNISSQMLSGLLMALPCVEENSRIFVNNLKSKPYIKLSLDVLKRFGIEIESNEELSEFFIAGNQKYQAQTYTIEGDWSSMSFFLVAAATQGNISIKGLNKLSKQSDIQILEVLKRVGSTINWDNDIIEVSKNHLNAFEFDATDCPDLFPPLVSLAAYCNGISKIKGVSRLKHKESDRGIVLKEEFSKLGIHIEIEEDFMFIHGGCVNGGNIDSHNDHRIAMAASIVALGASDKIVIQGSECVSKSYPDFFKDLATKLQRFNVTK